MKKLLSAILLAAIFLGFIPSFAQASEPAAITREEAIALACEVFSEYEAQIRGRTPIHISSRNAVDDFLSNIVVYETRITEDGETFTYQQDSRGLSLVQFTLNTATLDSSSGSGYAYRKCDLILTCSASNEILVVKNFTYTLVQNGYDVINNRGTVSESTATAKIAGYM